jgi:hypothetical protein
MAKIVYLSDRKQASRSATFPVIQKVVEGKVIECVNVDLLTAAQRAAYFSQTPEKRLTT